MNTFNQTMICMAWSSHTTTATAVKACINSKFKISNKNNSIRCNSSSTNNNSTNINILIVFLLLVKSCQRLFKCSVTFPNQGTTKVIGVILQVMVIMHAKEHSKMEMLAYTRQPNQQVQHFYFHDAWHRS